MKTRSTGAVGLGAIGILATALFLFGAGIGTGVALVDYFAATRGPTCEQVVTAASRACYADCAEIVRGRPVD